MQAGQPALHDAVASPAMIMASRAQLHYIRCNALVPDLIITFDDAAFAYVNHGAELLRDMVAEGRALVVLFPLRRRQDEGPWVTKGPDGGPLVGMGAQKWADIGEHVEVEAGAHRLCIRFNDDMRGFSAAAFSAVDDELTVRFSA